MDQVDVTAPAPIESTPAPMSATDHAAIGGDQSAYKEAFQAEQAGKPLPAVEPAKTPGSTDLKTDPAPAPERELSKRQQEQNERTRRAVEQALESANAEIARLKALAPRTDPAPAPTDAEHKRYLALPGAPKLDQFDSVEEYSAAMGLFIAKQFHGEQAAASQRDAARTQAQTELLTRDTGFRTRLAEAQKANPEFMQSIDPEIVALRPYDALIDGERPSAANELAEQILRSDNGPQLMVHLTENPDAKERLLSARDRQTFFVELGKVYAALEAPPAAPKTKTVSSAPEPPTTLGTKTAVPASDEERAVRSNDQAAFKAQKWREHAATQR